VIGFVKEMRPDLVVSEQRAATGEQGQATSDQRPAAGSQTPAPSAVEGPAVGILAEAVQPSVDGVAGRVLSIVAEKTGYPKDMLELELDLEADLGIERRQVRCSWLRNLRSPPGEFSCRTILSACHRVCEEEAGSGRARGEQRPAIRDKGPATSDQRLSSKLRRPPAGRLS
jgi:hypothetical protein